VKALGRKAVTIGITLAFGLLTVSQSFATTIWNTLNDNGGVAYVGVGSNAAEGQSFGSDVNAVATDVTTKLFITAAGAATLSIYSDNGGAIGTLLGSATDTFGANQVDPYHDYTFDFNFGSGVNVSAGGIYWAVMTDPTGNVGWTVYNNTYSYAQSGGPGTSPFQAWVNSGFSTGTAPEGYYDLGGGGPGSILYQNPGYYVFSMDVGANAPTAPEPATLPLAGTAFAALLVHARRRQVSR